ncbi:hypothetical protein ACIA6E_02385 [Streptomyces sp. NPDC051815]|uniref:hypothetical protein n=1 Tax=Streptomyces sp. NPDC051815 TaxID=3365674 RepID=UPI0037A2734F
MTPYSLAFYVDVVTTGEVLGAGPAASPERVTEVLGADYAENVCGRYAMYRDHGLVEFHWQRASGAHPWTGHHFTLQVHRLAHQGRTAVSPVLRARYGRFAPRLRFGKLRRLLDRRGVPLVEIPEIPANAPYFRTFLQPASRVAVSVVGARGGYGATDRLRVGDVYSVHAPLFAAEVALRTGGTVLRGVRQAP